MSSLDFNVYRTNFVSIKDTVHDVDISEGKWDVIFDSLSRNAESIYFYGSRRWVADDDLENLALSLGEEVMIDEDPDHCKLLFRLKPISMMFNRKSLSKIWLYYEYPSIIFLQDKEEEVKLAEILEYDKLYYSDIIEILKGVTLTYQSFEPDVLWLQCSMGLDLPVR